jgi:hypothetical protein
MNCCRSQPRCRACPLLLAKEMRELRELGAQATRPDLPPHLAGVPECLHKYEPLLRQAWEERAGSAAA